MTDAPARRGISPQAPLIHADLAVPGLMVGLPCFGGVMYDGLLHGMLDLQRACLERRIPLHYITVRNESLVQRARNRCVAEFLAHPTASHLLFIDADIGFTADAVFRLIAHDRPLIGGLYRRKQIDRVQWVWNRLPPDEERRNPQTGAIACAAVGTGFMLIRRDVITRMIEATLIRAEDGTVCSPWRYTTAPQDGDAGGWRDHTFTVFDCFTDETGNYLSEDYAFCRRWRELGGTVWADPALLLDHSGTATFAADPWAALHGGGAPA